MRNDGDSKVVLLCRSFMKDRKISGAEDCPLWDSWGDGNPIVGRCLFSCKLG